MPAPNRPIRVAHVITELGVGGAESMLSKLVGASQRAEFEHRVYALHGGGPFAERIEAGGIAVEVLGGPNPFTIPIPIYRLLRSLRRCAPDIVQTWLYRGDLAGLMAQKICPGSSLIWNIRNALVLPGRGRVLPHVLARFSADPDIVLANSWRGKQVHEEFGYRPRRWMVIPNGFDLDRFRPDADQRVAVRKALGIPESAVVIGAVGRWDPMKGFDTLSNALERLARRQRGLNVLFVGRGLSPDNPEFARQIEPLRSAITVHCLGERTDPEVWFNAMDLFTLPSRTEGFPNVLGEAMASGLCCVATDVGDSAQILGDTGWIVPPEDPGRLATALEHVCELMPEQRSALGSDARQRIGCEFSLGSIVEKYEALYRAAFEERWRAARV